MTQDETTGPILQEATATSTDSAAIKNDAPPEQLPPEELPDDEAETAKQDPDLVRQAVGINPRLPPEVVVLQVKVDALAALLTPKQREQWEALWREACIAIEIDPETQTAI